MIDTDKYEGHTEGPWRTAEGQPYDDEGSHLDIVDANGVLVTETSYFTDNNHPNIQLIADAPIILEEYKQLRGLLMKGSKDYTTSYMDLRGIIEDVHWELTGNDHESNEARIKYALIALRDVIG
jgi:hypothetical protein